MIITPRASRSKQLTKILNETLTLRIYTNDVTLGEVTAVDDLVEASGAGYSPIPLLVANWNIVDAVASHDPVTFTFTAAHGNCYGIFFTWTDASLAWAERFPQPATGIVAGAKIIVIPQYVLGRIL